MNALVLVAAGSGTRMGTDLPKQFIKLKGKPLLMHSLERFLEFDPGIKVVLVLPPDGNRYFAPLRKSFPILDEVCSISGGVSRTASVKRGLSLVPDEALVGIHDAVRPLVTPETISRAYHAAEKEGGAIPVIAMEDSVRRLKAEGSKVVDRSVLRRVQTPQVFRASLIKEAYRRIEGEEYSDDGTVYETCFTPPVLVEGSRSNIKVTTPEDLLLAEFLLSRQ